jgi:hypothetical protein
VVELLAAGVKIDTFVWNGDLMMDKSRKIGDIKNNSFSDNTNFQGDENLQSKIVHSGDFGQAFSSLIKDIQQINDESQRKQAEFFAEQLKEAFQTKDTTKAKKVIGFLKNSIGTAGSLAGIARFFGLGV